ncbi:MAG: hypothetical protein JNJ85_16405 [Candidatus Kapabacteria bacterium]|nr:hypothetical protein [Candidatus Kapabacteria bacterium]
MEHYQPYKIRSAQCELCINLIERTRRRCDAFPHGIPPEIWNDEIEHTRPYPGDGGIMFEKKMIRKRR